MKGPFVGHVPGIRYMIPLSVFNSNRLIVIVRGTDFSHILLSYCQLSFFCVVAFTTHIVCLNLQLLTYLVCLSLNYLLFHPARYLLHLSSFNVLNNIPLRSFMLNV